MHSHPGLHMQASSKTSKPDAAAKHTPGPWTLHGCYVYRTGADGKRAGNTIANTRAEEFVTAEEEQANAQLLAAAPELLEALRQCVEWHGRREGGAQDALMPANRQPVEIRAAMAAIAKALGRSA